MLTQARRLLGIFKTCAPVPPGQPWGVEGTHVLWAGPPGTAGSWQQEEAFPATLPSPENCPLFWNSPPFLSLHQAPKTWQISGLLQRLPKYVYA